MFSGCLLILLYFLYLQRQSFFLEAAAVVTLAAGGGLVEGGMGMEEGGGDIYGSNGLKCRFKPLIPTWRRYEFLHMFFWCLKDYSWCVEDSLMWFIGAIPTLFISFDLIWVPWRNNSKLFIDLMHYCAQFLWVISNITWAFIELFEIDSDLPPDFNNPKRVNGRLVAFWILVMAWIPILILYLIWLPLTCSNQIQIQEERQAAREYEMIVARRKAVVAKERRSRGIGIGIDGISKAEEEGRVSNHYIDEAEEQDEDDERRDGMDSDRKRLLDVPR